MAARGSRAGFTLVELMVTTAISAIVLTATCVAYLGTLRMVCGSFAEAELALRTRELRDKLLFHAAPTHDGVVGAGLLSAWAKRGDGYPLEGSKILVEAAAMRITGNAYAGTVATQEVQLVFHDENSPSCTIWNEDRHDEQWAARWLHPGRLDFFALNPRVADILVPDARDPKDRFYINVAARKEVVGRVVEHRERIVVPVFGRVQRSETDGTGGLGR